MSTYTVTATRNGFVQGVHHNVSAADEAAAIELASMYYPPRMRGLSFRAAAK